MYGPQTLGASVTVGAAAVLPATGNNSAMFIAAAVLFVAGLATLVVSKFSAKKN